MIAVISTDIGIEYSHSTIDLFLCISGEYSISFFVDIWHELTHIELIEPSDEYITETRELILFTAYEMSDESSMVSDGSFFGLLSR